MSDQETLMNEKIQKLNEQAKLLRLKLKYKRVERGNNWLIKRLDFADDYRQVLSFFIEMIFYIAILGSALFLIWYMIYIPTCNVFEGKYFDAIEMIFIAPLPLIIIFTFYNYYIKVFKITLFTTNANKEEDQRAAMQDIGITKYLFVSILISTIFILIFEYINRILNLDVELAKKYQPNESNFLYIGLGCGLILLIILIVYLNRIEKHVTGRHHRNLSNPDNSGKGGV